MPFASERDLPPDSCDPIPVRGVWGWSPDTRIQAANQLKTRLHGVCDVVQIAETGAEHLRELLSARTVTVIALRDGKYFDIVNVGHIPRGNLRYPSSRGYPTWEYPLAAKDLEVSGGYFTTDSQDPRFEEYVRVWDDPDVHSIMGVGIYDNGQLHGEIFHTRDHTQPSFDQSDLDLARDVGTSFGPAFVKEMATGRGKR